MALIRLYMTISLDGYVTGPRDSPGTPMGTGGSRLFNWLDRRNGPGPGGQVYTGVLATRAVISGRWQGGHHDGVPVFVLTRNVPDDPLTSKRLNLR
ncbi:MAG TPA: hypothetical protein VF223_29030 [Trebonia sp.]